MKLKKLMLKGCVITLAILYILYTPSAAIKSHLFFSNPIKSLTCSITKSNYVDSYYGQQYLIEGFDDIHFGYVNRNLLGWCYWAGGGSGP